MKKKRNEKKEMEFSKKLLLHETLLLWVVTLAFIVLAFVCIANQYFGELPWLTAMAMAPWGAYAVGQGFYYRKAEKENIQGGIKYETVMAQYKTNDEDPLIDPDKVVKDAAG